MPSIRISRDYDKFELLQFNRNVNRTKHLESSMSRHGWIDAYPAHVVENGNGKLKIKAGHHRFFVARKLNLPIKFVVCDDDSSIHELEKATTPWRIGDYLESHLRTGNPAYSIIKEYHDRTGISISSCISMLSGETAGSTNKNEMFKRGEIKIKKTDHAETVAGIVAAMKKAKIKFATNNMLVQAISRIAWVKKFSKTQMIHKIKTFPSLIEKRPNVQSYSEMLSDVYNRQSKTKIPLAFMANETMKKRSLFN